MLSQLTLLLAATTAVLALPQPQIHNPLPEGNSFQISTFGSPNCKEPALRNNFSPTDGHVAANIPNAVSASLDPQILEPCKQVEIQYFAEPGCTGEMIAMEQVAIQGPTCHNFPEIDHQCAIFSCSKNSTGVL